MSFCWQVELGITFYLKDGIYLAREKVSIYFTETEQNHPRQMNEKKRERESSTILLQIAMANVFFPPFLTICDRKLVRRQNLCSCPYALLFKVSSEKNGQLTDSLHCVVLNTMQFAIFCFVLIYVDNLRIHLEYKFTI